MRMDIFKRKLNLLFKVCAWKVLSRKSYFSTSSKIPTVTFNNGYEIPIFGLGTWKSEPNQVTEAVKLAIDVGYRHIDSAYIYLNEKEVGAAIAAKIADCVVKREDLFITSKLWNTCHRTDLVVKTCKKTLSDLGLKYLDLYLVHWPTAYKEGDDPFPQDASGKLIYSDADFVDTWKEMEKLVECGLVRSIGVSNFNPKQIERVLKVARCKPVTNQVECHPYLNQKDLMEFCRSKDITITAYSPLGTPDRPWAKPGEVELLKDPKLKTIAAKYCKSVAQILIRYQVQRCNIVIPKSVTPARIKENIDIFDFALTDEDMKALDALDCNGRYVLVPEAADHKNYPFK